jgi:hypothetical protein
MNVVKKIKIGKELKKLKFKNETKNPLTVKTTV